MRLLKISVIILVIIAVSGLIWFATYKKSNKPAPKYTLTMIEAFEEIKSDIDTNWRLISISSLGDNTQGFIQQLNDSALDIQLNGINKNGTARTFIFEFINQYDTVLDNSGAVMLPLKAMVVRSDRKTKILYNTYETDIKIISDTCIKSFDRACSTLFENYTCDMVTFNANVNETGFHWEFTLYDLKKGEVRLVKMNETGDIDSIKSKTKNGDDVVA